MRLTAGSLLLLFTFGFLTACSDHSAKASAMRSPAAPTAGSGSADRTGAPVSSDRITREVRHELVMLPYYGVFDNLAYRVDGATVTLLGQVTRPALKSDAGNVVKQIEGVDKVDNQIQVLPLSPMDDRIRIAVYRSVYGQPGLDRYAMQA